MNSGFAYFAYLLIAVVVVFFVVKKITSCLFKSLVGILLFVVFVILYILNS